jgi:hypothetical protein
VVEDADEIGFRPRVRQRIERHDGVVRLLNDVMDEVRTDEPRPTSDEYSHIA